MPLYFFHLSFGKRFVRDDEGVELRDRAAARDEAAAVIRDLCDHDARSSGRRWASWFLQVADERGDFLRLPIGHPVLEIVSAETGRASGESSVDEKSARCVGDQEAHGVIARAKSTATKRARIRVLLEQVDPR